MSHPSEIHDPRTNGSTEPCDAPNGEYACSCGAWHTRQPSVIDEAFAIAMRGRVYGVEETRDAREWFELGYAAAIEQYTHKG